MDVTQIPFNKLIEISDSNTDDHVLSLRFKDNMKNHLGTFHASAQFALAEACSGLSLQKHFPHPVKAINKMWLRYFFKENAFTSLAVLKRMPTIVLFNSTDPTD